MMRWLPFFFKRRRRSSRGEEKGKKKERGRQWRIVELLRSDSWGKEEEKSPCAREGEGEEQGEEQAFRRHVDRLVRCYQASALCPSPPLPCEATYVLADVIFLCGYKWMGGRVCECASGGWTDLCMTSHHPINSMTPTPTTTTLNKQASALPRRRPPRLRRILHAAAAEPVAGVAAAQAQFHRYVAVFIYMYGHVWAGGRVGGCSE